MNKLPSYPGVDRDEEVKLRGSRHIFMLDPTHPFHALRPGSCAADGRVSLYDFELAYGPGAEILEEHSDASFSTKSVPLDVLLKISLAVSSKEGGLSTRPFAKIEALGRAVRAAALSLRQAGLGHALIMGPDTYIHQRVPTYKPSSRPELDISWGDLGRTHLSLDTYVELRHLMGPSYLHDDRWDQDSTFSAVEEALYRLAKKKMRDFKRSDARERAVWIARFFARSRTPWTNADFRDSTRRRLTALRDRIEFHFGEKQEKRLILAEHVHAMLEEYPNVSTLIEPGTEGDVAIQELFRLSSNKTFDCDLLTESGWGVLDSCLEGFVEGVRQVAPALRQTRSNITLVLADSATRNNSYHTALKVTTVQADGSGAQGYSRGQQQELQQLLRSKASYAFQKRLKDAPTDFEKIFLCLQSGLAPVLRCIHSHVVSLDHEITGELHRLSARLKDGTYYRMSLMVDPLLEMGMVSVKPRFLKLQLGQKVIKQLMAQEYGNIDWYNDVYREYANVKDKGFPLPALVWPGEALEDALVVSEMPSMMDRLLHPLYDVENSVSKVFDAAQDFFVAGVRKKGSARVCHFQHYVEFVMGSLREAQVTARMFFTSEAPEPAPLGPFAHAASEARRQFNSLETIHEHVLDLVDYKRDFFESGLGNNSVAPATVKTKPASQARAPASTDLDDLSWANKNIGLLVDTNRITIINEDGKAGITCAGHTYVVDKARAASLCGCKANEKCWWTALSHKSFPTAVICCPFKGAQGHRSVTDSQHTFTEKQLKALKDLAGCPNFR
jgi:hypothetical protein